jgi:hypothetical protein
VELELQLQLHVGGPVCDGEVIAVVAAVPTASNTYAVRPEDAGRFVSCLVTGSNAGGFETTEPSEAMRVGGS